MNVGVVGLGKVGLPLALVLHHRQHKVIGYDLDLDRVRARLADHADHGEVSMGYLLAEASRTHLGELTLATHMGQVVTDAEVVFVVVQTQHRPGYGGEVPMPAEPADFDYTQLREAVGALWTAALTQRKPITVAIVSTVLPGTIRRELLPLAIRPVGGEAVDERPLVRYVYNPALISLGTVVPDLLKPDFILIGADDDHAASQVEQVWAQVVYPELLGGTVHHTSIESAELLKVALNAYLSSKIMFANTLAELCQAIDGADVDEVTDGLALSRKAMGRFGLRAGMGDGGPCRPRDTVALSWLTLQCGLPTDPFHFTTRAREAHTRRLARLAADHYHDRPDLIDVVILGWSYKPGTIHADGSPARLLHHYLTEEFKVPNMAYDPVVFPQLWPPAARPAVYVLATPHPQFDRFHYPPGSVVIDPHGRVADQEGVTMIRVGRR
jgi:UDPglucose 6-dehydrogenase